MPLRLADTFTSALARLGNQEQKQVKTAVFDLQAEPERPGLNLHPIKAAGDKRFRSARVSRDLRLILLAEGADLLVCYVGHHDDAYAWARRRKLEPHPYTGAAQLVVLPEVAGEAPAAPAPASEPALQHEDQTPYKPPLFLSFSDEALLRVGVPEEWLETVRQCDEDALLDLVDVLPEEALEALLSYAVTGVLAEPEPDAGYGPLEHPDARRRFRLFDDSEALERALSYPLDQWSVFLHPAQERVVARSFNGPARVTGSAGTGKTVVALHRAVRLARAEPGATVLLGTFSQPLAASLQAKLARLVDPEGEVGRRIAVAPLWEAGRRLAAGGQRLASPAQLRCALARGCRAAGETRFSLRFLYNEWRFVVDARQLRSWEAYRDAPRPGRKMRLGPRQREALWQVFGYAWAWLAARNRTTAPSVLAQAAAACRDSGQAAFDYAVVDEAQDLAESELSFLAAAVPAGRDRLFFTGDLGQRIFQPAFSWLSLGVDVRGRSLRLRVNFRTAESIKRRADRLLPPSLGDRDGYEEDRGDAVSLFDTAEPALQLCDDAAAEQVYVAEWLAARLAEGLQAEEMALFVRSAAELPRARAALEMAEIAAVPLARAAPGDGRLRLATMHGAKGQEFRAVAVMACDEDVVPAATRIAEAAEEAELDEIFATERHLLYVAMTRAREAVQVTGCHPGSPFLADLLEAG